MYAVVKFHLVLSHQLSGLVHEEVHPCVLKPIHTSLEDTDAGCINTWYFSLHKHYIDPLILNVCRSGVTRSDSVPNLGEIE